MVLFFWFVDIMLFVLIDWRILLLLPVAIILVLIVLIIVLVFIFLIIEIEWFDKIWELLIIVFWVVLRIWILVFKVVDEKLLISNIWLLLLVWILKFLMFIVCIVGMVFILMIKWFDGMFEFVLRLNINVVFIKIIDSFGFLNINVFWLILLFIKLNFLLML